MTGYSVTKRDERPILFRPILKTFGISCPVPIYLTIRFSLIPYDVRDNISCRGWLCYPSGAVAATTVQAADAEGRHTKIPYVTGGLTPAAEAGSRTPLSPWTRGAIFDGLLLLVRVLRVSTVEDRGAAGEGPD